MATRCRKYLKILMHNVAGLGETSSFFLLIEVASQKRADRSLGTQSDTSRQMFLPGPDAGFETFSLPLSELSEISPMGLDMGPFMTGFDWERDFTDLNQAEVEIRP